MPRKTPRKLPIAPIDDPIVRRTFDEVDKRLKLLEEAVQPSLMVESTEKYSFVASGMTYAYSPGVTQQEVRPLSVSIDTKGKPLILSLASSNPGNGFVPMYFANPSDIFSMVFRFIQDGSNIVGTHIVKEVIDTTFILAKAINPESVFCVFKPTPGIHDYKFTVQFNVPGSFGTIQYVKLVAIPL